MTNAAELRSLDDADLSQRLVEARQELFNLRFQLATGRLDNVSRINSLRKEVARLLTLQGERSSGVERGTSRTAGETTGRRGTGRKAGRVARGRAAHSQPAGNEEK